MTTTHQGYAGFAQEFSIAGADWHSLTEGWTCPVTFVVGADNLTYTAALIQKFLETLPASDCQKSKMIELENAGHLALYQAPDRIFGVLSG